MRLEHLFIFRCFVGLVFSALFVPYLAAVPMQEQKDIRKLVPGLPIERELRGGEVHFYLLALTASQYLCAVADQRGIDVVFSLIGPDGKKLAEVDSPNGAQGPEPLFAVTEVAGDYRLEIRSLEKEAPIGRYEVKIAELRAATSRDKDSVAGQLAYTEAESLREQATADSLPRAIKKYEEAIERWRSAGNIAGQADAFYFMGLSYFDLGDNRKALSCANEALALRRAAADRPGEAWALQGIGAAYIHLGEGQKALEYLNQALTVWRALNHYQGQGNALCSIGLIYSNWGEKQKALEYLNEALKSMRSAKDQQGEAYALTLIGSVYHTLGEVLKALDSYNQALPLRQSSGDRRGEGDTRNNLGALYAELGETQTALSHYDKALSAFRIAGDRQSEAGTLQNMGAVYFRVGEKEKSLDYYSQALPIHQAAGDRKGEANTLQNMGVVYANLQQKEKALDYYNRALAIWRALGDRAGKAASLASAGRTYNSLGERQKALDLYNQALTLNRAVGDRRSEADVISNLGWVYADTGDKLKALDCFNQALTLSRSVGGRYAEVTALHSIAQLERDRANLLEARKQIEAAISIAESLRSKIPTQELRASYLASVQDYYQLYIDILMRLNQQRPGEGFDGSALQASERARGRSLLELLAEAKADIRQGADEALLEKERSLQKQLEAKEQYRMQLLNSKHTAEQAAEATKSLRELTTQYQEVQAKIRTASPRYAALTQPQPLSLKEIQKQVLDTDTLLLEYSLGTERSYLWVVSTTSIDSFQLPRQADVEAAARRYYELTTAAQRSPQQAQPADRATSVDQSGLLQTNAEKQTLSNAARNLTQMLLEPAASRLGTKRLLIVADGALVYVPFAALPITKSEGPNAKDPPPLIAEHEIVSIPSASTLAILRRETAGRSPAGQVLAVMADPVFTVDDLRVKASAGGIAKTNEKASASKVADSASSQSPALANSLRDSGVAGAGMRIPRLPGTRREALGILAMAPEQERKQAFDFDANRDMATSKELAQYRLVHFATHGLLNSTNPELSGLVLSLVNSQGQMQEGFLRLNEIYNMRLQAELVVLSACQSALGKEVRGEGLIGLTRGFMYAGAARVVASLWKVEDRATAELMRRFYEGILGKERLRAAAALRAAQLSMWKEKRWQEPFYWAAFTLQGEWR